MGLRLEKYIETKTQQNQIFKMALSDLYNRKNITILAMSSIILLVIIYGYSRGFKLILGPNIAISSPSSGVTYEDEVVTITGQASRISKIYLNDRQIFTDDEGNFTEKLLLMPGYNILTLRANDLFDRSVSKKLELVYLN